MSIPPPLPPPPPPPPVEMYCSIGMAFEDVHVVAVCCGWSLSQSSKRQDEYYGKPYGDLGKEAHKGGRNGEFAMHLV